MRLSFLLGCLAGSLAISTAHAQSVPMRLLAADSGWILAGNHLLWTSSAGLQWEDITPQGTAAQAIHGVYFLDTSRGWLLRSAAAGASLELARTSDGGKTWAATAFPLNADDLRGYGGAAALDFIDSSHGWAMLRQTSSSNFSLGLLFATHDGGATWTKLPNPPLGDPVRFTTSSDGWLAGGATGNQLYVTRDGGHTWSAARVAPPAGIGAQADVRYSLPVFESASNGVLAAHYSWSGHSAPVLYQTVDGGVTWQAGTVAAAPASDNAPVLAVVDSQLVRVPASWNGATTTAASFASLRQGWILTAAGHCQGYKTGCSQEQRLWATSDGGATYQDVTPPLLRAASSEVTPAEALSIVDGSGEGFDLCSPTISQLQAWYPASPYRYVNVYIGGSNAACPQPGLSQSWVNQVIAQGWGLIPTWVGPQAPNSSCGGCSAFSTNPTTAASQGTTEAQSAASLMSSIGLSGTVIYYDLEQYTDNGTSSPAASAFVNAWVQELHVLGYTAGVYGAPSNANTDWLNISNSPDAVWIALWNGVASVWNLSPIPNTVWANHQRIHQYTGGVNQTYGGVTLNIDQDYLDGPIATTAGGGTPSFSISASPSSLTIAQGASGTSTISTTVSGGFNAAIALSAAGLPSGATASFNPSSIAAPGAGSSTMTITVGASTVAATYSITVTGSGGGLTQTATVSLTVSAGGGSTQLMTDGGFESATVTGNSAPGWTGTTNISGHTVIIYQGAYPHSGTNYAYEGAYDNDNDTLTQTVTIPSNATSASLTFWVNIVTQETSTTTPYDFLYVEIHNSSGTLLATPLTLNDLNATSSSNTNGVYFQPAAINLLSYAGRTIQIVFHATTDGAKITTFRIDDVSLLATTSGGTPSFSMSASPTSLTIAQGSSGTSTISTTVSGGFNAAIALSASGLPSGATASFNPSSIAAPGSGSSTLTISVGSSTVAGTYNVTVTGSGGGITHTAAVSLTVSSGGGSTQIITDGGFESATVTGNSAPGWTATTNISGHAIIIYHSTFPHTGYNYAYEGAYNSLNDKLTQTVTIPANASSASLTFWVNIVTQETSTTTPYDFLYVEIHNSSGKLLARPLKLNDLNSTSSGNTDGVYFQPAAVNLLSYKGQTIQIVFHATTDASNPTTFRIDDVSLVVTP